MGVGVEGVEWTGPSFSAERIVIQGDVNLWHILADVVTSLFAISIAELQEVGVEVDTMFLVILIVGLLIGPQVLVELVTWIEPSEGSLVLKVAGANPERTISIPWSTVLIF